MENSGEKNKEQLDVHTIMSLIIDHGIFAHNKEMDTLSEADRDTSAIAFDEANARLAEQHEFFTDEQWGLLEERAKINLLKEDLLKKSMLHKIRFEENWEIPKMEDEKLKKRWDELFPGVPYDPQEEE